MLNNSIIPEKIISCTGNFAYFYSIKYYKNSISNHLILFSKNITSNFAFKLIYVPLNSGGFYVKFSCQYIW